MKKFLASLALGFGLLLGGTAAMAQTAPAADVKVTAPAAAPAAALRAWVLPELDMRSNIIGAQLAH